MRYECFIFHHHHHWCCVKSIFEDINRTFFFLVTKKIFENLSFDITTTICAAILTLCQAIDDVIRNGRFTSYSTHFFLSVNKHRHNHM
jgi:hypothetical protein